MQADDDERGHGLDLDALGKSIADFLLDGDHDGLAGLAAKLIGEASLWRGRSRAQAEAIAYLKARVDALEGRERDRLYQPPGPPRREMPGSVAKAMPEGPL